MSVDDTTTEVNEAAPDLDAAVWAAVTEGLVAADRLADQVTSTLDACAADAYDISDKHGDQPGQEIIGTYTSLLAEKRREAERRFASQRTRLKTFNLVLFGRTGAGKSSLIEALSCGNGEPISEGESDWTTDVREVFWNSTRLVDTPGIGGWGRTMSRNDLEARAKAAVADADVVILCFDTQSQQSGEFDKVAQWVGHYGKPVVAVLNSRNARWRHPMKVESQHDRRHLSQTVHEHTGNIRDELVRVGLSDVPVVAISSKRAAFARTADPYLGPDGRSRQKQRDENGPDQLLEWSNLPALELLLTEALRQQATPLRLGMLHKQARGLLKDTEAAVREHGAYAGVLAEQLERGIADVLALVGRPTDKELKRGLKRLERLRGSFAAAEPSELRRHARHRLRAGLREARVHAYRQADEVIEDAFAERDDLEPEVFDRRVLASARAEAEVVAREIGSEIQQYLLRRLALIADNVQADITAAMINFEGAGAKTGKVARAAGIGAQVLTGLLSIGSGGALLAAALSNSWNPAGWVFAVLAVGGILLDYAGGRFRKKGAADRTHALSDARSRGRRAVTETFDLIEKAIGQDLERILSSAAHERLRTDINQAAALRLVEAAASATIDDMRDTLLKLPKTEDASNILAQVARQVQHSHHPDSPDAERLLWLGESWCGDPEGSTANPAPVDGSIKRIEPTNLTTIQSRFAPLFSEMAEQPACGTGISWLRQTHEALEGDHEAVAVLSSLPGADNAVPRIVVAGDYSTGKSSFIKRLIVDADLTVPGRLKIAAPPTTAQHESFTWEGWELIDTPGFQGSVVGHSAAARDAIAGASVLIVLFNPNLVVGDAADLARLLFGNGDGGLSAKLPRTIFVINRSDELGIDAREDLEGYQNLCRRKELELAQALGSLHGRATGSVVVVDTSRIVCVASDPHGLVGDREDVSRLHYDRHRDWDGMDGIHRELANASSLFGASSADIKILDNGAAILGELISTRREHMTYLEAAISQERRLLLDVDSCLAGGRALRASSRDRLATRFVGFAATLFDDIERASDDASVLAARVKRLESWANDPELRQLCNEWTEQFARECTEWQTTTSSRIEARLNSAAFVSAFGNDDSSLRVDHLKPDEDSVVRKSAKESGKHFAASAAKASRETVTKVAHQFGHKFKPWGATKLTKTVNKAGGALGIALGSVELYSTWRSAHRETAAEKTASEHRSESLSKVREAAYRYFDAPEPDAPGAPMTESLSQVETYRRDLVRTLNEHRTELALQTERIDACERQMHNALQRMERS